MKLGLLSDTHGRVATARLAVRRLEELGCEFFIHCGDVGDNVLELLPEGRSAFVLGNNDWDEAQLARIAAICSITNLRFGGTLELGGVTIGVTHGDRATEISTILAKPGVRYLFTGHSHVPHDRRQGGVRWVNPGALHRASRKTVATLDLETDALAFHEVVSASN